MASPSLTTDHDDHHDPEAISTPTHDIEMFGDHNQDPPFVPHLLCDCHITLANDQALHEVPDPSRLVGRNPEPCLECALFVARQGELLTKDDLCFAYFGSRRCSHCIKENHDCVEIHCDILRHAVQTLFELCLRYFYEEDSQSLYIAASIFKQQQEVLLRYAASL